MKEFTVKSAKKLDSNFFKMFDVNWGLLVAGQISDFNMMTISWGGIGILWNKEVCTVYVRPSRYTFEYMEKESCFSVNFMREGKHRKALEICGSHSGRTVNKQELSGLTPGEFKSGQIILEEADLALICHKIYWQDLDPKHFLSPTIHPLYKGSDYHRMYIGEIETVLMKK